MKIRRLLSSGQRFLRMERHDMERHDMAANIAAVHICMTNAPKMNFKELGCDDVEWMNLAQNNY
jgi:hypothetical protein